jgi:5-methylcytosine-specific restriction endonuclease McrA
MRERVRRLFEAGKSQREIAAILGVGKSTVAFHVRNLDVPPDPRFARRFDWPAIRAAYESGLSMRECMTRFGFSADAWHKAAKRGEIVPRPTAMPIEELLVADRPQTSRTHLKQRLVKEGLKDNRCERCGLTSWLGGPLSMQLHHINGDGKDNRFENIQFLCANCHSQTGTYGGRNGHRAARGHLRLVLPPEDEPEEGRPRRSGV